MNKLLLNFLGTDSGFGDNNNSAYIETAEKLILIDCGFAIFNKVKNKFDFNKYNEIDVIITHLHNDHAGSLSQLILYLWFGYNKKVNVISACENIEKYLEITGTPNEAYNINSNVNNIIFIKTEHVENIDAYGFYMEANDKKIIYTGDTNTLKPFERFFDKIDEIYIDVSKNSDVHLKIDHIMPIIKRLQKKGIKVIPMHIDDYNYIENTMKNVDII